MKTIRPQLQQAKDAYRSERYPGDLSADVMARTALRIRPTGWNRTIVFSLVTAACAAMVIVVMFVLPAGSSRQTVGVNTTPLVSEQPTVSVASAQTPSELTEVVPDLTSILAVATDSDSDVSFVPTASSTDDSSVSFGFSVPSFPSAPSWDGSDTTAPNSSTTQEVL